MIDRITSGRTDLVFDFVGGGQPATFCDAGGASLISTCSYYGDVSAVRFLLSQGERLESLGPNLGLDSAAFHGHWQLCEFLLESGADANYADPNTGETGLHAALRAGPGGWHRVIERLVAIGVLREYRRARGEGGEQKFEIALLYRPGLGIKAFGV